MRIEGKSKFLLHWPGTAANPIRGSLLMLMLVAGDPLPFPGASPMVPELSVFTKAHLLVWGLL